MKPFGPIRKLVPRREYYRSTSRSSALKMKRYGYICWASPKVRARRTTLMSPQTGLRRRRVTSGTQALSGGRESGSKAEQSTGRAQRHEMCMNMCGGFTHHGTLMLVA